jgi:hypothetical protein
MNITFDRGDLVYDIVLNQKGEIFDFIINEASVLYTSQKDGKVYKARLADLVYDR